MDKKSLIFILLLLPFTLFAQCGDNIRTYRHASDSCNIVIMSDSLFGGFYLAKKNLDTLKKHVPLLRKQLFDLDSITDRERELFKKEIIAIDSTNQVLSKKVADLNVSNKHLRKTKRNWIVGSIIALITLILIQ